MVKKWVQVLGLGLTVAVPVTALAYVLMQPRANHLRDSFDSQWDVIFTAVALVICGLIGLAWALRQAFSVLGAFQENNLARAIGWVVSALILVAVGGVMLWGRTVA